MKSWLLGLLKFFPLCVLTWVLLLLSAADVHEDPFETALLRPAAPLDYNPGGWIFTGLCLAATLLMGGFALKIPRVFRWAKILFWVGLLPLLVLLGIGLFEHWNLGRAAAFPGRLAVAVLLPVAALGWMGVQARRRGPGISFGWTRDAGSAVACYVIPALLAAGFTGLQAMRLRFKAEARWAAMGRPMEEYGRHLVSVEENASFQALEGEFKGLDFASLYKPTVYDATLPSFPFPRAETGFFSQNRDLGDEVQAPEKPLDYLAAHHGELVKIQAHILERDVPVWEYREAQGNRARVPNYLLLHHFSQLSGCQGLVSLSAGDLEGAALASAALLKATRSLADQPSLSSFMINVSLQSSVRQVVARLPEDPQAWDLLEKDAARLRARLPEVLQADAYAMAFLPGEPSRHTKTLPRFQEWLLESITHHTEQTKALGLLATLETVDILQSLPIQPRGDLGYAALNSVLERHGSKWTYSFARTVARLNAALLLREQAEMIRFARARMQEGVLTAGRDSVVVPGCRWEIRGEAATHSARLTLVPVPDWLVHSEATPPEFFLMPLDGSQPWRFRAPVVPPRALSTN